MVSLSVFSMGSNPARAALTNGPLVKPALHDSQKTQSGGEKPHAGRKRDDADYIRVRRSDRSPQDNFNRGGVIRRRSPDGDVYSRERQCAFKQCNSSHTAVSRGGVT